MSFIHRSIPASLALVGALALGAHAAAPKPSYGFNVDVTLSPKAAALLKSKKEKIIVSADYTGEPVPARQAYVTPGGIDLGREEVTIPGAAGRATLTGRKVVLGCLSWIKGSILININVYTARLSSEDNLIDCGLWDGPIADAQKKAPALSCKLIGE